MNSEHKPGGRTPSPLSQFDKKDLALAEDAIFVPSAQQKKAKHRFQEQWDGHTEPTAAQVVAMTGMTKVDRWWSTPGFKEWLIHGESLMARLNYLVELSLDTAEQILSDPDAPAAARAGMIKTILAYKHACEQKSISGGNSYESLPKEELLRLIKKNNESLQIIDVGEESE